MNSGIVNAKDRADLISECIYLASHDPEKNLLLLADLYPPHSALSETHIVLSRGKVVDFSNLYKGFADPSIVLGMNEPTKSLLLRHVLSKVRGKFTCICEPEDLCLFNGKAEILDAHNEYQMTLRRLTKPTKQVIDGEVKSIERSELNELDHFYKENGATAWLPIQFDSGPYYCVRLKSNIVSAAGVHFATPQIAQLGNIVTAKAHRKKGYASLCTYVLASKLISSSRIVSLFVFEDNIEAIRIYEKIGFIRKRKIVFATLLVT